MGVVRDITITVPTIKGEFETKLRKFVDRKNLKWNSKIDLVLPTSTDNTQQSVIYIYFDRGSYNSFLFLLMRLVKTYYETDVKIVFDADGDMMDEHMEIEYVDGKFNIDMEECDVYQMR